MKYFTAFNWLPSLEEVKKHFESFDWEDLVKYSEDWIPVGTIEEADVVFITNYNRHNIKTDKLTILITAEPNWSSAHNHDVDLSCYDYILGYHDKFKGHKGFIEHDNISYPHVRGSYNGSKDKRMSMVTSSITSKGRHYTNYDFRHEVVDWILSTDMEIDIFGRGIEQGRNRFDSRIKGGIEHKDDGLFDYQYSIAIENCCEEKYFTEKIGDCFLSKSVPLYMGEPNIKDKFKSPIVFNRKNYKKVITDVYHNREYTAKDFLNLKHDEVSFLNSTYIKATKKLIKNGLIEIK